MKRQILSSIASAAGITSVLAPSVSAATSTISSVARITMPSNTAAKNPIEHFDGDACASSSQCFAVGTYSAAGAPTRLEPMVVSESAGQWGPAVSVGVPTTAYAKNPGVDLGAITCPSVTFCLAVGSFSDAKLATQAWSVARTGATWGHPTVVTPPVGAAKDPLAFLNSISCVTTSRCVAVGSYANAKGEIHPMVATYSPSGWSRAVDIAVPANYGGPPGSARSGNGGGPVAELNGISCVTATICTAVGSYTTKGDLAEAMVATSGPKGWSGATEIAAPLGAAASPEISISGISCIGTTCTIAGSFTARSGGGRGFVRAETAGVWSAATLAVPPPASAAATTDASLSGISCVATGQCFAAGVYQTTSGPHLAFGIVESGGVWKSGVDLALPNDASTDPSPEVDGVACRTSVAACVTVGGYATASGPRVIFGNANTSYAP